MRTLAACAALLLLSACFSDRDADSVTETGTCFAAPTCIDSAHITFCGQDGAVQIVACGIGEACFNGACVAQECTPGDIGCAPDHRAALTCGPSGTWTISQSCGSICYEGKCIKPNCQSCTGNLLVECKYFFSVTDCAETGGECKVDKCVWPPVPPLACEPTCAAGQWCNVATDPPTCQQASCSLPTTFGQPVARVVHLAVLPMPEGCDLDGDGTVDNAFAQSLAGGWPLPNWWNENATLAGSIADGQVSLLLEPSGLSAEGTPTGLRWLVGNTPDIPGSCPGPSCPYTVQPQTYDQTATADICPARAVLPAAIGPEAAGYGPGQALVPFFWKYLVTLQAHNVRLVFEPGDTAWPPKGNFKMCGWFTRKGLTAGIEQSPARSGVGGTKSVVTQMDTWLKWDIDVDGAAGICTGGPRAFEPCQSDADCGPGVFVCKKKGEAVSFAYELRLEPATLGKP